MWQHVKVCKFKPSDMKSKPGKTCVQALCSFAQEKLMVFGSC